jgi:transketolase
MTPGATSGATVISSSHPSHLRAIERHALNIRRNVVRMLAQAGSGHTAGSLGLADVFATLYFGVMQFNPDDPNDPNRDFLVLSAGHVCPALYATLAERGLIPEEELMTLRQFGSRLQGHPERDRLPWLETTSGPLGCGLSQAAGMAYATKNRVYVITGDGELDEGNNWEAIMFAGKNRLNNLTAIVDRNNIQIDGTTEDVMPLEPLADKWQSFGWHVIQIDGNNVDSIIDACSMARAITERPTVIIAYTIPGKGVDFIENDYRWHGKAPTAEEARRALAQLEGEL